VLTAAIVRKKNGLLTSDAPACCGSMPEADAFAVQKQQRPGAALATRSSLRVCREAEQAKLVSLRPPLDV
jgi:hypothetical protein